MSRVRKILLKAERDGTAAPFTIPEVPKSKRPPEPPSMPASPPTLAGDGGGTRVSPQDRAVTSEPAASPPPPPAVRAVSGAKPTAFLVAARQPASTAADHYRSLRDRMKEAEADIPRRVILVTSPGRGDGKTVTAGNLAVTLARDIKGGVLIVDAALRRPRLHALLGIAREPGLVDVLTGTSPLDQALVSLPALGLCVLPAGRAHGRPDELLASAQMRGLIGDLRKRFERLLLDSAATDTGTIQTMADGVLLVVRAGRTTMPAIDRALSVLPAARLLGLVLNDSLA
jgi:Mrp family chromosome partitioning ATPase